MERGGIADQSALYPLIMHTMQDEFAKVTEMNRQEDAANADKGKPNNGRVSILNPDQRLKKQGYAQVPPATRR